MGRKGFRLQCGAEKSQPASWGTPAWRLFIEESHIGQRRAGCAQAGAALETQGFSHKLYPEASRAHWTSCSGKGGVSGTLHGLR